VNVTITAASGLSAIVVALLGILGFFARQLITGALLPRAYFDDLRADRADLRADRDMWKEACQLSEQARLQGVVQVGHLAQGLRATGNALERLPGVVGQQLSSEGGPDVAEAS
jgi:hypothetical protein